MRNRNLFYKLIGSCLVAAFILAACNGAAITAIPASATATWTLIAPSATFTAVPSSDGNSHTDPHSQLQPNSHRTAHSDRGADPTGEPGNERQLPERPRDELLRDHFPDGRDSVHCHRAERPEHMVAGPGPGQADLLDRRPDIRPAGTRLAGLDRDGPAATAETVAICGHTDM